MKFHQDEAAKKEKERQAEAAEKDRERQHLAEIDEKKMQFDLRKIAAEKEQREYEDVKLAREREQARIAADRAEELEKIRHAN